jgi:ferric-dicitrate binding protein FerR (iron transport regulator)
MDEFLKYFENEKFIHWIYNPDQELNDYWDQWFREHPQEKREADLAAEILKQLHSRSEQADPAEVISLYSGIIKKIGRSESKHRSLKLFPLLMRYAAVALIFLSVGILLTYYLNQKKEFSQEQALSTVEGSQDAQLILADGRKIALNAKESKVEYSTEGKIVINQKDTLLSNAGTAVREMNQLIVPYGKNSSLRLSDGTVAYLNAGSKLTYPTVFDKEQREVILVGEGYFEVMHDPNHPFIVKTSELSVVALGTIFNVSAYPGDKIIETVLVEGEVVLRDNPVSIFKKDFILKPNELAAFNRETLETTSRQVDAEKYVAWRKGILNFQSNDLNGIIHKVERYYNITVLLEDPSLGTRSITGKLMLKEDKEGVLEVLASTARVELQKTAENTYRFK